MEGVEEPKKGMTLMLPVPLRVEVGGSFETDTLYFLWNPSPN